MHRWERGFCAAIRLRRASGPTWCRTRWSRLWSWWVDIVVVVIVEVLGVDFTAQGGVDVQASVGPGQDARAPPHHRRDQATSSEVPEDPQTRSQALPQPHAIQGNYNTWLAQLLEHELQRWAWATIFTTSSTTCGWRTLRLENFLDRRTPWRTPGEQIQMWNTAATLKRQNLSALPLFFKDIRPSIWRPNLCFSYHWERK